PPHLYWRRPRTSAAEVDAGIVNGLPGTNCFTAVLVPSTKDRIDAVILRRALSWTDRLIPNATHAYAGGFVKQYMPVSAVRSGTSKIESEPPANTSDFCQLAKSSRSEEQRLNSSHRT